MRARVCLFIPKELGEEEQAKRGEMRVFRARRGENIGKSSMFVRNCQVPELCRGRGFREGAVGSGRDPFLIGSHVTDEVKSSGLALPRLYEGHMNGRLQLQIHRDAIFQIRLEDP